MQKTERYQFNLLDLSDELSTEPLNENMRKVEQILETKGECRMVVRTYRGDNTDKREFDVGFRPKLLILLGCLRGNSWILFITEKANMGAYNNGVTTTRPVELTDRGFISNDPLYFNQSDYEHTYIAFG